MKVVCADNKDVKSYIISVGCKYFINEIILDELGIK